MIIGSDKAVYVYHRTKGMMITDIMLTEIEIKQIINKIAQQRQMFDTTAIQYSDVHESLRVC